MGPKLQVIIKVKHYTTKASAWGYIFSISKSSLYIMWPVLFILHRDYPLHVHTIRMFDKNVILQAYKTYNKVDYFVTNILGKTQSS